jgi:hypothetical protein
MKDGEGVASAGFPMQPILIRFAAFFWPMNGRRFLLSGSMILVDFSGTTAIVPNSRQIPSFHAKIGQAL